MMGHFSDIDILDQDRQMLVAARVRVVERLKECRDRLESATPETVCLTIWEQREVRARIAELEPLARMLGIE